MVPGVDVHRAGSRATTRHDGVTTRHSFSSGHHYDPANTSYGLLLANDEHLVSAGAGFPAHEHRDVLVVTWVLEGVLRHEDSTGHAGLVRPGSVQLLSAGSGVGHSEHEGGRPGAALRFVQTWVVPDAPGGASRYEQQQLAPGLLDGTLAPVASGLARHRAAVALRLDSRGAALHAGVLAAGCAIELPEAPYVHVQVVRGGAELEGAGALAEGDAVRLTATGGRLTATGPCEVLVWEMHAVPGA